MEGQTYVNKHGLFRGIPSEIKRAVRQRCGFGCVKCGSAIYRYHHFNPPFEEAETHTVDGITLLCGACHDLAHGFLSLQTVQGCNQNPKCLEQGFSYGPFDVGSSSPVVVLGNPTFIGTPIILEAFGKALLAIEPAEQHRTPFRLSATLHDRKGNEILRIVQNEWQVLATNWDMEVKKSTITIRHTPRQIALKLRSEPPGKLVIETLDMFYGGLRITSKEGKPTTAFLPDGTVWFKVPATGATISGCARGIVID